MDSVLLILFVVTEGVPMPIQDSTLETTVMRGPMHIPEDEEMTMVGMRMSQGRKDGGWMAVTGRRRLSSVRDCDHDTMKMTLMTTHLIVVDEE